MLSQRCWLAALLAFRHSGLEQYFWCQALRESGGKKRLQFLHLRFLIGFAIDLSSGVNSQANGGVLEDIIGRRKKEEDRSRRKNFRGRSWKKIQQAKPTSSGRQFYCIFKSPVTVYLIVAELLLECW